MGKEWKQWQTLFSWSLKSLKMVTATMKLKDVCPLEEKLWTNLDSILKSRDITLLTKVHLVKAMVLPLDIYGCKSWTIKKVEGWRMDLKNPLDYKEIKSVNPKGINPEYSLEGLLLKLKLQHFGHLIQRATHWKRPLCWEKLKGIGEGHGRGWDGKIA